MQKSESEEAMSARIWLDVNIMGNEKQKRWHWPAALRNDALARKRDIKLEVKSESETRIWTLNSERGKRKSE